MGQNMALMAGIPALKITSDLWTRGHADNSPHKHWITIYFTHQEWSRCHKTESKPERVIGGQAKNAAAEISMLSNFSKDY